MTNRSAYSILFVMGYLLVLAMPASAETTQAAHLQNTQMQSTPSQMTLSQKAKMWGLTKTEYQTYLNEMATTPSGHWWKKLDPPQVLGQNATSVAERMKYARIDVKLDQERAGREIAFQHAYTQAFDELYPHAKLIQLKPTAKAPMLRVNSNDHYFLFTRIDDPKGAMLIDQLMQAIRRKQGVQVNLFFVGKASDAQIEAYAQNNAIAEIMPHHNKVTLNHNLYRGVNKLKQMIGNKPVQLPLLVRVRDGQSKLVSASQLS